MEKPTIEYFDFQSVPKEVRNRWTDSFLEVVDKGRYIGGEFVSKFEVNFAGYIGTQNAVGVGNGLDAISIALRALGVSKGDKVAVPAHTFIATWLAIDQVGAIPVGIDCDKQGLLNLDDLENNSENLKAVIPVHMHGMMVNMPRLMEWANKNNVLVIEDCAQAHGAHINNRKAGSWGHLGAFSFYPTKNLGALGDAGMVTVSDELVYKKIKSLSNYGKAFNTKYEYEDVGTNSRLDSIQANILNSNLELLDSWNQKRKELASIYIQKLQNTKIEFLMPEVEKSIYHHFVVLVEYRDEISSKLLANGVGTEIHYPNTAAEDFYKLKKQNQKSFLNAKAISKRTLSLPLSPWMQESEVVHVSDLLSSILQ